MQPYFKVLLKVFLFLFLSLPGFISISIADGVSVVTSSNASVLERVSVVVDPEIQVNYSGTINGLLISVQNGFRGDMLYSENNACSYNEQTMVMTCSGDFTSTQAQAIFRSVTFNTFAADLTPRKIDFVLGKALPDPSSGRFYEFFQASVTWEQALDLAAEKNLFGLQGYLATIPNQAANDFITTKLNADPWVGGSDDYRLINEAIGEVLYNSQSDSEGYWYWITGPEKGQMFYNHRTSETLTYSNWASGEPNNFPPSEHFLQLYSGNNGLWNDLPSTSRLSYVVAYGGFDDDPEVNLVSTKTVNVLPVVSYFNSGASAGTTPIDSVDYQLGDEVTVLANEDLVKEGAVFVGWSPNSNGDPLYQAGDTFLLEERTTLRAIWFTIEKEYETMDFGLGWSSVRINNTYATGLNVSKAELLFEDLKEGDIVSTYLTSGQYSYWYYDETIDQYLNQSYMLTVTQLENTLIFETDQPIPVSRFTDILNNTQFETTGETGLRTFVYRIFIGDQLAEVSSQINVVPTFTVTYLSDEYQQYMPNDSSLYIAGNTYCPYTPSSLNSSNMPDFYFIGWSDENGRFMNTNDCYRIDNNIILRPVLKSKELLQSTDKLFVSDFVENGQFELPEGYIENEYSWLENYSFYLKMLVVNHEAEPDFSDEELSEFLRYMSTLNGTHYQMFYIKPLILYFDSNYSFPYTTSLYFYGDFEQGIQLSFVIPLQDRGFTNYRLYHIDEDEFTEVDFDLDSESWVISFTSARFSPYALVYDLNNSDDEVDPPVDEEEVTPPVDEEEEAAPPVDEEEEEVTPPVEEEEVTPPIDERQDVEKPPVDEEQVISPPIDEVVSEDDEMLPKTSDQSNHLGLIWFLLGVWLLIISRRKEKYKFV